MYGSDAHRRVRMTVNLTVNELVWPSVCSICMRMHSPQFDCHLHGDAILHSAREGSTADLIFRASARLPDQLPHPPDQEIIDLKVDRLSIVSEL